ncbi:MAG: IncP-type conjugal transfer protein TraG [Hyphomicrobiales bacterium]|nr:IncP-type conjugal transfer protein TraG [Hyphomicrobiales bacterium]
MTRNIVTGLTASLGILASLQAGTQWAAARAEYSPRLGAPLMTMGRVSVYEPWRIFVWQVHFHRAAPRLFDPGASVAAGGSIFAIALALAFLRLSNAARRQPSTFGSARWAWPPEIEAAGLMAPRGVILGRLGPDYLRHDGPEHVLLVAPTRAGKGAGLIVPTLLAWPGPVIVHDIKGENWRLTAGWRSRGSHILRFDPADPASARFNPLLEVRRGKSEVRDAQTIADILVDPDGALERRSHWEITAQAFLTGLILHVLYAENEKTLARMAHLLSDPARPVEALLETMRSTPHLGGRPHPVAAAAAADLLNKAENERSGVISTAVSFMSLYRDPVIAAVTAASDWRLDDLNDMRRPVSLYMIVSPSDLSRTRGLIRLILNQIARRLTETLPASPPKTPLLLLLDEFPALGNLDFFETALGFLAGYGVRAMIVAQSLHQVEKAYGPNNAILDNCHVRVAFAPNDDRTARRLSDLLGVATAVRNQSSYSGKRAAAWLENTSVARQEAARPLLTPGEVMQLASSDALIFVAGVPPIRAQKVRYFEDGNFIKRLLPPPADAVRGGEPAHDWRDLPPIRATPPVKLEAAAHDDLKSLDDGATPKPRRKPRAAPGRRLPLFEREP